MKIYTGIDLGSTTTKAIVLTGRDEILGRGITNSRSNYDVACALARGEAMTTARFTLLRRRIEADPALAATASTLTEDIERLFRLEQHDRQLSALREACHASAWGSADLSAALEDIFEGMGELSATHFSSMEVIRARSDFFRDLAASQYLRIAETVARESRIGFERLMSVFDKAILLVENARSRRARSARTTRRRSARRSKRSRPRDSRREDP